MTRRVALILATVSAGALAGCGGVVGARMTFDDTETTKITDIVLAGGVSDVTVRSSTTATETRIQRIIRGGSDPGSSYQRAGGVVTLATDCGRDCAVSYEITALPGVTVRGELTSGDVQLDGVGPVDLRLTSGDVTVQQPTGPVKVRATSGELNVIGGSAVTLEAESGDIGVMDSTGPVTTRATSGNISLRMAAVSSVAAAVSSGDIDLVIPAGDYRLRTSTGSGDAEVHGVVNNPQAKNVLDLHTRSGELKVTAN